MRKRSLRLPERQRLHHDEPVWASTTRRQVRTHAKPTRDTYDIIIVGAGISGALMAYALADGKRSIAMIDRREPVRGSTLASTAMILHELDTPLHALAREIGRPRAERVWRRSAKAVHSLLGISPDIGCGLRASNSLYLAGDVYGSRFLRTEADARRRAGLDADYLSATELAERYGIDRSAAIVSPVSATANPAQLTASLIRAAQRRGLEVISNVEVKALRSERAQVFLATSQNSILSAAHVVLCTGYELIGRAPPQGHSVVSTWAVASRPGLRAPPWLRDHVVWEGSEPYLYLRLTHDGRLIAGGEDEDDPEAYKHKEKSARIAERVSELLGVRFGKPEFRWSAPFGKTTHGMPLIGEAPQAPRVHVVMGYGGNGITFSQIAAEMVSARIAGRNDPDRDLFRFDDHGSPRQ